MRQAIRYLRVNTLQTHHLTIDLFCTGRSIVHSDSSVRTGLRRCTDQASYFCRTSTQLGVALEQYRHVFHGQG